MDKYDLGCEINRENWEKLVGVSVAKGSSDKGNNIFVVSKLDEGTK